MKKFKTVIVTGGYGFIGSNLVKYLIKKNYFVINIDKLSYSIYQHKLGGQFRLKIPVIKKHNIKLFADKNRQHGLYLLHPFIVFYFSHYDLINRVNED